jgi:hypothetical protein
LQEVWSTTEQSQFFLRLNNLFDTINSRHYQGDKGEHIMKWVTRSHVHVDRVACPWLISRFVDSDAEFLFVPASQVEEIAKHEQAIPFDIPGAELGHHEDRCSFDAIIDKYQLKDKALLRLARIINAADTDRMQSDPIAAGLEAIAVGFSLRFPNDYENLRHQFEVYDSLYTWCRLEVAKQK